MKGVAMSELEKAKQEVEQVCFAYDKAGDTGDIKDWKGFYDLENKLIEKVKIANQPSLTIPKSIAEKIDKFIKMLHFSNEFEAIKFLSGMDLNGDRTPQWLKDNPMLVFAYLAGKALGVDLVKVGEG